MENWGQFFDYNNKLEQVSQSTTMRIIKPQRSFGGLQKLPTSRNNNNTNEDKNKNYNFVLQSVCLSLVAKKMIFQIVDLVVL